MPDSDPNKADPGAESGRGVIFLHATGTRAADDQWVDEWRKTGRTIFSHRPLKGCETTRATLANLGQLLSELSDKAPGQPVLIVRSPMQCVESVLQTAEHLVGDHTTPRALTAFSNTDPAINPFANLATASINGLEATQLVEALGERRSFEPGYWPTHFVALNAPAVSALGTAEVTTSNAYGFLINAGGSLLLPGWLFLADPEKKLNNGLRLAPHETARPTAWGGLSQNLQEWITQPGQSVDQLANSTAPATLHITHSWGGGVSEWVQSFIATDSDSVQLQLRSEGPQSGQGAGQRLSLFLGNQLKAPLEQWWLQPPIQATVSSNSQYQELLAQICERYGIGRVIVSSLVGHSLDALKTGLPTLQVLHDHYPTWPLLSIHPEEFDYDLAGAIRDPRAGKQFPGMGLAAWEKLRGDYLSIVGDESIKLAAPSQSVIDVQRKLSRQFESREISIIPHGFIPMESAPPVEPRDRDDGRLRLVIPGRIHTLKGADIIEEALPELTKIAQVYLLGTGKDGERFFGQSGVHVILEYKRAELPSLLQEIGPHAAALLSVVPETFSYTLSEMQALGIPVIATRVGSFQERIEDGENGWLINPNAGDLVSRLTSLQANTSMLQDVRSNLADLNQRSLSEMIQDYNQLCEPIQPQAPLDGTEPLSLEQAQKVSLQFKLLSANRVLGTMEAQQATLQKEVKQRTRWATDVSRQLKAEIKRRREWVAKLETALATTTQQLDSRVLQLDEAEQELRARAAHLVKIDEQLDHTIGQRNELSTRYEHLSMSHEQVLSSQSWRITKPLRAGRRAIGNAKRARIWNPARWPLLMSQLARNLSTQGVKGTLDRLHRSAHESATESSSTAVELIEVHEPPQDCELPQSLPTSEKPLVSVVIPAYNHLAHTAACLDSIANTPVSVPFEVIVIDDESSDETQAELPSVKGLRYLRNENNLGFIRSCNRAADEARGEFLVLLNNDTQVRPGWLEHLLDVFDQRDDAGLVGSRLVYPDGTLQECGGMVFSDGSGWNYGRGDNPNRPEYQYLREVDYCSGACIMLRTELFESLGGFDEHYVPAYYEDTDLAFKIREQGLKVYVQPASTIVHFEGISSGTDETQGTKRYQVINREKFQQRWAEQLKRQPAPIEDPDNAAQIRASRDHRLDQRVLLIDAYTPEPDQDSGSVRLTNLMQCLLDSGHGVTFFADNLAFAGKYTESLQRQGVQCWYGPWLESSQTLLEQQGQDYDLVIVSRHYIAVHYLGPVRKYCPQARFVFDTVDLHYLREQRQAQLEDSATLRRVSNQTRRSELAVIKDSDATLVVSPVEKEVLSQDAPDALVHILSNIHEVGEPGPGYADRQDLYFVGGYQHPPNIDAAIWFVNEIWPLVRKELPDVKFHLVGSKATEEVIELGEHEGVIYHGFVDSVEPFLQQCRLSVAPLRYGAGVKGKVNQSMSHGQPVVATPTAVEGIYTQHEHDVLVAESAADFASAVVRLYRDESLWNTIAENAISNVEEHFSMAAAKNSINVLLSDIDAIN